jgi:hypothetical protein
VTSLTIAVADRDARTSFALERLGFVLEALKSSIQTGNNFATTHLYSAIMPAVFLISESESLSITEYLNSVINLLKFADQDGDLLAQTYLDTVIDKLLCAEGENESAWVRTGW